MKCYYEILGVSENASDQELKAAYRKQALVLHPDKNRDNPQATQDFQLLQQAYEVLSDPHERAFYDRHRDSILKGADSENKECLDVYKYFTSSCYQGFGDEDGGFYQVYRDVFNKIAAEDMSFMEDEEKHQIPDFGKSDSDYDTVVGPFYAYWQAYCTFRPFYYIQAYDIRQADNRRIARLIEKENKKLRDVAKKKRNEEVRELVNFVRKRDRRVQAHKKMLEEKAEEINRKAKEMRERHLREKLANMASYTETEWASMAAVEDELQKVEELLEDEFGNKCNIMDDVTAGDDVDGEAEEVYEDMLFCVACDKDFKSDKAYANHCRSKKHLENVVALQEHMREEDRALFEENDEAAGDAEFFDDIRQAENDEEEPEMEISRSKRKNKKKNKNRLAAVLAEEDSCKSNSEKVTKDDAEKITNGSADECQKQEKPTEDEPDQPSTKVKLKGKKAKEARRKARLEQENQAAKAAEQIPVEVLRTSAEDGEEVTVVRGPDGPVVQGANDECDRDNNNKLGGANRGFNGLFEASCSTCGLEFPSRNKMFEHLKKTGHAALKTEAVRQEVPKKSTKSGKKGR